MRFELLTIDCDEHHPITPFERVYKYKDTLKKRESLTSYMNKEDMENLVEKKNSEWESFAGRNSNTITNPKTGTDRPVTDIILGIKEKQ